MASFFLPALAGGVRADELPSSARATRAIALSAPPTAATASMPADPAIDLVALLRRGLVQVVRFQSPEGAEVECATSSGLIRLTVPSDIVLVVGRPYRLRVSHIPDHGDLVVYPTLRLLGSITPPPQTDPFSFAIPLHFVPEDFEDLAEGRMVRNVVYLEDPRRSFPMAYPAGALPVIELGPGVDALAIAGTRGRPVALVQIGTRVPLTNTLESFGDDPPFFFAPRGSAAEPEDEVASGVRQAAWQEPAPIDRLVAPGCSAPPAPPARPAAPFMMLSSYDRLRPGPDEFLCDGGDDVPFVHFIGEDTLAGLEPSEVVAEFKRPGEKPRIATSNRVCIYAPRFALMRSSLGLAANAQSVAAGHVAHLAPRGSLQGRTVAQREVRKMPARAVRARVGASGILIQQPPAGLEELRVIAGVEQETGPHAVRARIGPEVAEQSDEARIAMAIQAAAVWQREQFPMYTAINQSGAQLTGRARTGELDVLREPPRAPGELVLVKTASTAVAHPGDVIEFAISYRNAGDEPVESVSIIDSLTTRLEYVPGSAQTDRRAVFTAAPNDADSQELRWDISEPVPGGQGGVVWFKAKVR